MSLADPDRREGLDELLSDQCRDIGPTVSDVLGLVRREKQARARKRSLSAAAVVVILASLAAGLPLLRTTRASKATALSTEQRLVEQPFRIERVDDEGLLALLRETPAALVRWPDGRRDLMLVVQTSQPE